MLGLPLLYPGIKRRICRYLIAVVCVYNKERPQRNVILRSLKNKTVEFELITVDTTSNEYKSMAEALNYDSTRAKDDYNA